MRRFGSVVRCCLEQVKLNSEPRAALEVRSFNVITRFIKQGSPGVRGIADRRQCFALHDDVGGLQDPRCWGMALQVLGSESDGWS